MKERRRTGQISCSGCNNYQKKISVVQVSEGEEEDSWNEISQVEEAERSFRCISLGDYIQSA
jgi:hypothetical protein